MMIVNELSISNYVEGVSYIKIMALPHELDRAGIFNQNLKYGKIVPIFPTKYLLKKNEGST